MLKIIFVIFKKIRNFSELNGNLTELKKEKNKNEKKLQIICWHWA